MLPGCALQAGSGPLAHGMAPEGAYAAGYGSLPAHAGSGVYVQVGPWVAVRGGGVGWGGVGWGTGRGGAWGAGWGAGLGCDLPGRDADLPGRDW